MARKVRLEYSGAIYHVLNRGDRREPIFLDDLDRRNFVQTLGEACLKTGWQVHAYVLMPNHFHLVVETPQPNLVVGMKWLLGTYTIRFNRRHNLSGHVFSGRYKALIVDGSGNGYLKSVCDYVHLNPSRAGMLGPKAVLKNFAWSSWPTYLQPPSKRPSWLRVDRLLGEWGISKDSSAGRRHLELAVEAKRGAEDGDEFRQIRRGWCFGDEEFREELLAQMHARLGVEHFGSERIEAAELHAEKIVARELKLLKWHESELKSKSKRDSGKLLIAARLRAETTLSVAWIAERLGMGTRGYLNHLLYLHRKNVRK